ncbi:helix-turn-helix transcriptional regulator [Peribacillus butanolivorans]|uniref:helix-turn-helix transcriptional regulator n=1 Tax=Peribacillus butanolivorans TaxID=421767 RepID=UPI0036332C6B
MDTTRNKQLGEFLKTRRARINPEMVGLPSGGRRRTAGLRREEVAQLAGISVDWYTWLEQGRNIHVSTQVLEDVARVLQLSASEKRHMFLLAEQAIPIESIENKFQISSSLQYFLDYQNPSPAYVTNSRWDFVAWNQAACKVFGDYNKMSELERNSVWRIFTSSYMMNLLDQWEEHAQRRLAQFRDSHGKYTNDPWWNEMIDKLSKESEKFRELWPQYEIMGAPEGNKVLHHPQVGELILDHISFQVSESPDLLVTVHLAKTKETFEKLQKLLN